jgi:hypothetical protein
MKGDACGRGKGAQKQGGGFKEKHEQRNESNSDRLGDRNWGDHAGPPKRGVPK